jgi:serine/threonine-protein kinase
MGKVYEGEERLSKRRVAVKVLRPELVRSDDARRLFLNEMQILAHLEHPNIVRSLASVEQDGQLALVLEFLNGRTLRQLLVDRRTIPWAEAVEIASQVAEALAVAHAQEPPIVHRDLKPENVMFVDGAATQLKVMDFGIAKVLQVANATNTQSIGTLQYMSPEQIDARPIDARSDLYSLGLILYEMLAGGPPFVSASPRELLNMQCTTPPPALPEDALGSLPSGVEELVFALLEKEPARRPTSAAEVGQRLAPFRPARRARTGATSAVAAPPAPAAASGASPAMGAPATGAPRPGLTGNAASLHRPVGSSTPGPTPGSAGTARSGEPVPRTDTIALVEKATRREGRELPTWVALVAVAALSIVAGLATYLIRMRSPAPGTGPGERPTATARSQVLRGTQAPPATTRP